MKKPTTDNTTCVYAFSELALKQWQGTIINATPCCNMLTPGNKDPMGIETDLKNEELSIDEIFNHASFQNLRKQMLNGEQPKACQGCFKSEALYNTSYRLSSAGYINSIEQVDANNPDIQILDLSTGDSCNLRCRMCHPGTSNQLRIDSTLFKKKGFDYSKNQPGWWNNDEFLEKGSENKAYFVPDIKSKQWEDLKTQLRTVKIIKASGGETLMSRSFIDFLDYAIEHNYAKNIELHIHTNGTKFNDSMFNRFRKFKKIAPDFSIDGIDKIFEYIRYPAKFNDVEQNLYNFFNSDVPTGHFRVNFVLMSYNIHGIKDMIDWMIKFGKHARTYVQFNIDLVNPLGRNIDIKWLPPEMILGVINSLKEYENYTDSTCNIKIKKALNYMRECVKNYSYNEDKLKRFKEETVQFDSIRNQTYKNYCHPELVQLLDSIKI
jgi:sulfatase maturation enzyme AslB (radical SAM superfamily)